VSEVGVVRGGHVLTMGPSGDLEDGAVAFAGGQVLEVGPFAEVAARHPEAEVVGDDQGVVLPGLVNAHTHLSEGLLCGMGEDLSLLEWLAAIITPTARHLTQEMARVGAMLKGAELLLSGVTCVNDMFCHTNEGSLASLGAVDGWRRWGCAGWSPSAPRTPPTRGRWHRFWPSTTPWPSAARPATGSGSV